MIGWTWLTGFAAFSSMAGVFSLVLRWWRERVYKRNMVTMRTESAEEWYRFLRRLDHELKNPLTAMQLGLANLADVANSDEDHRRAYASIQGQIIRMSRLIASLRKLADLETGSIEHLPIDVRQLLEDVFAAAQEDPEAESRQMRLNLPSYPLPSIEGDRDLLQLAIYNLLDNALKFTHRGDRIELDAYIEGNWIVIEVSDTGRGIPVEDLPHVWEELYRSQSVHGIPGSGLGLALVKTIAEKHGGSIDIESEAGVSTMVRLDLPAS